MSLIELAKSSPGSFDKYRAEQIVAFAGAGKLRDGSECSNQLRGYLETVSAERLGSYAQECLDDPFTDSGLVLQDVVNELGRRLEFEVQNGRYKGVSGGIGFDGIWHVPNGPSIIVEVKTTDAYNVSLDGVAGYKPKLQNAGLVSDDVSILFVVGRQDTGALEAQIRGSKYAWDMRVVGVESLIKLVSVKEKSSEDQTVTQIRELLRPFEYTRVDRILDVVFNTATDVVNQDEEPAESEVSTPYQQDRTPQSTIEDARLKAVGAVNLAKNLHLVRKRQALFEDNDASARACVTISKRYEQNAQPYWYAYHPKWDDFLSKVSSGFMVFGCIDRSEAFAIPLKDMRKILPSLNQTIKPDGSHYWHVKFVEEPQGLVLFASKTGERFSLDSFGVDIAPCSLSSTSTTASPSSWFTS
jgi:hypothetical protein